ncbi:MFS transporter, NNP family, nitrate/nitrite transporter [Mytilus galloprovincialis]|uniref:MFS transporter, NNP family, nitrate/nitrite transporter n=1 Tax=Mytilus galloprovincialis TaxID=29158 RepID=A0A8B6H383_MYTGA|nr:MFS transporter, NNP family, nitrate/nitrite transporter [Mytilus galloprovincialis]
MSYFCRFMKKLHAKEIKKDKNGKAKQFQLFSIRRPYMRAFHTSRFCFFLAFTSWFGIQPLIPTIMKELKLSKTDVANSGIASVAATIGLRIIVGPLCDRFGPRKIMSALLLTGSIPMALAGLIKNGTGLIVLRLFIGVLGGAFVPCQFWTSIMFNSKIVGTANALVGGWGNLGGGFTFLFMPAIFQLVKFAGADEFLAWKIAVIIPALICCIAGVTILFTSDDCPQGPWRKRILPERTNLDTAVIGEEESLQSEKSKNYDFEYRRQSNAWTVSTVFILCVQYGLCFGVEIATNTVLNLYLLYKFKIEGCNVTEVEVSNEVSKGVSNATQINTFSRNDFHCSVLNQNTASLIASLFGLMNLFARALGGSLSDALFKTLKLPGRLIAHQLCLAGEGVMLIIFSQMTSIPSAIATLTICSVFVQASEGTTFSLVPYVKKQRVGVIAGLVGAGGNTGAIIWNTIWVQLVDINPSMWFWILGVCVICGSTLTLFIRIENTTTWHLFKNKKKEKRELK